MMTNIPNYIKPGKVVIVGAGNVGVTTAFALAAGGFVSELALIDLDTTKAEGEVLDLQDGLSFLRPLIIKSGDYSLCRDAQIVIITAGIKMSPGDTRLDLAEKNASITDEILNGILQYNPRPVIIIATNPVDVLTWYFIRKSGLPPEKVIGSGTVLDSSRLRHLFSRHCNVDPRNVHGYVIGEHGDGSVIVWSTFTVGGLPVKDFCISCNRGCDHKELFDKKVKSAAYRILEKKGATYYSVALALRRITESIIRNENSILTVSVPVPEYYGINEVCLSLPSIINNNGLKQVLHLPLAEEELEALKETAEKLQSIQEKLIQKANTPVG